MSDLASSPVRTTSIPGSNLLPVTLSRASRCAPATLFLAAVLLATMTVRIAEASYSPGAFELPDGFVDEEVAGSIDSPVGLTFLPDGRILVTEQFSGEIAIIPVDSGTATSIFTVPDIESGGEKGLLGIAVDPNWPTRPYVYVYFDHSSGDRIHIRMYTASGDLTDSASSSLSIGSPYEILTDIPDVWSNHNGGTVRFGVDGMLYASTGDDAEFCNAQDLTSLSGKILRLDVSSLPGEGSGPPPKSEITPTDNPFPGPNLNERLIYSYGLRNPFRFHIDPKTGVLYIGDVGPGTYEEIDEATGGDNFGWPKREGAHPYPPGDSCAGTDGTDPIWEYDRTGFGASIIGDPLYRLGGVNSFPIEYDGDLFFHEYYQGFLRRLTFNENTQEWEPASPAPGQPNSDDWGTGYAGVSEIVVGPDGSLYYAHQWWNAVRRIRNDNPVSVEPVGSEFAIDLQIEPNPVSIDARATLRYELPSAGPVELTIHDISGALVARILEETQIAGTHRTTWDGRADGTLGSSGVYFARLKAAGQTVHTKLTIVR